jgi:hypothetical protein
MKEIADYDYDSRIVGREKLPPVCINLLTAKYRRLLQVQLLKEYTNDLLLTASKQQVATENCALIGKLHIFGRALPFLSNLLVLPNEDKTIDSKVLYDQAKTKRSVSLQEEIFKEGELRKISYVYTREQFLEEWRNDNLQPLDRSLRSFDCSQKLSGLEPPASKELIFKWAFSIPDCKVDPGEKDALKHFTTMLQPFTGRLSQSDYREGELGLPEPPRDKYLALREHYRGLVDYIEASVLLISLQVEDSVLQSLEGLMRGRAIFEERYALVD